VNASTFLRLALVAGSLAAAPGHAALRFHWSDSFSDAEKTKLETWLRGTQAALDKLVGAEPFDVVVDMHRGAGKGEPVPWGNTDREPVIGVTFHVDPAYSLEEFRADWTAPHELSHLVLPWLGRDASWFAEGFASYMQYQVMQAMGVMSAAEVAEAYAAHLAKARKQYNQGQRPFVEAAPRLFEERRYPAMYWGGAAYFLQADARLRQSGSSVLAVLRKYLACCRRDEADLDALVAELDRLSKSDVFSVQLKRFRTVPGFPEAQ
jgi:hypothetical protein